MIKLMEGNLFDTDANIIAHQVNCQGVMGSGVARQIKERYPWSFRYYYEFCKKVKDPNILLGICYALQNPNVDKQRPIIAHLFGQSKYGMDGVCYTNVESLKQALSELARFCIEGKYKVAMPYKIGCARGGADWDRVSRIIEEIFTDIDIDIEIWKLRGDEKDVYV